MEAGDVLYKTAIIDGSGRFVDIAYVKDETNSTT